MVKARVGAMPTYPSTKTKQILLVASE
ncbi:hypothetical protein CCACVL1_11427 [Corchorus capsularis]|uniref:Uncharacterized protein n=1 Tax=Corchorus capsularis TaxID=210143 RepID=A0A1R3IL87_COCAP|nr:hypothetical protein CCACVL1_11427 [Corchorus capsularis]